MSDGGSVGYGEQLPPDDLRPFVRAFWWRKAEARGPALPHRVLPDGCADLLIDLGDDATDDARLRWVGTMTRARLVEEAVGGRSAWFGVRFQPGALGSFVRAPLASLTDAAGDFAALDPSFTAPSLAEPHIAGLLSRIIAALRRAAPVSSPILRLASALGPQLRVDDLCARTGWSARTLERRFLGALGVSPKQHLRYLRFENALAAVRRGERFTVLALAAGYADQAHFSREFSRFSGLTPRAYRLAHPPPSR